MRSASGAGLPPLRRPRREPRRPFRGRGGPRGQVTGQRSVRLSGGHGGPARGQAGPARKLRRANEKRESLFHTGMASIAETGREL